MGLAETEATGSLFRIGRAPDPWAMPPWSLTKEDGSSDNRWDDPQGVYRVLYAGASPMACLIEVLARYRPDPLTAAGMETVEENDDDYFPKSDPPGTLRVREWAEPRLVGIATLNGNPFAEVSHSDSLRVLNRDLAAEMASFGIAELDTSVLRGTLPIKEGGAMPVGRRDFTKRVSRYVFDHDTSDGRPFAGIYYLSRLGDDLECFAMFEGADRWTLRDQTSSAIDPNDLELRRAVENLGIEILE